MNAYLRKPVSPSALSEAIAVVIPGPSEARNPDP